MVIPNTNIRHLMLRRDVVDAVESGTFHIYAVETIDEGIEILTGVPAGERDASGKVPEGSVNQKVESRLIELAEKRLAAGRRIQAGGHCEWAHHPICDPANLGRIGCLATQPGSARYGCGFSGQGGGGARRSVCRGY